MTQILKALRHNHFIEVDGVKFAIRWSDFGKGTSFFIPCINAFVVTKQVKSYVKQEGWQVIYSIRAEGGYFGVRFWRTM
jgi:hypothetical protein